MSRWWLPLQSLVLAVVVTWPAAADLGGAAIGSPEGDVYKHLWTLWWMRTELLHGVWGLHTTLVNFPGGMDLWPIEPLNGLLAPLLPLPVVALANVLALLHVFLTGVVGGWFGRVVSRRPAGALVAGAILQASAFTAFTLQVGVGELRQVWWLPLGLGCLVRARDTGEWRWFLALAGALVGATLSCFYFGFFLGVAVAIWALCTLHPRLLLKYAVAAGLAVGGVMGPVRTFTTGFNPDEVHDDVTFERWMADMGKGPIDTYPDSSIGPDELLTPRDFRKIPVDPHLLAYSGGRYLGVVAVILALLGLAADPRRGWPWIVVAGVGILLSFGTVLWWRGGIYDAGGSRVVLPLAWINRALAYHIDPINFPARFIAVPTVALAGLAALATRWRWAPLVAAVAVWDLLLGDLVAWPRMTAPLPDAAGLARAHGDGGVADLTPFVEMAGFRDRAPEAAPPDFKGPVARRRAIAAQLVLGRPFDAIPIERMDRWAPDGLMWLQALPFTKALAAKQWGTAEADWREDLWLLRDRGFDGLLITHSNHGAQPDVARFLTRVAGDPVTSGAATLWTIPAVEATADEQEAWRVAQAARLAAVPKPVLGRSGPRR